MIMNDKATRGVSDKGPDSSVDSSAVTPSPGLPLTLSGTP
ncbi:MAG: hypothetical protein RL324_2202 [Verrucomicrobiota bacterium]|jgi:hypothetical protein